MMTQDVEKLCFKITFQWFLFVKIIIKCCSKIEFSSSSRWHSLPLSPLCNWLFQTVSDFVHANHCFQNTFDKDWKKFDIKIKKKQKNRRYDWLIFSLSSKWMKISQSKWLKKISACKGRLYLLRSTIRSMESLEWTNIFIWLGWTDRLLIGTLFISSSSIDLMKCHRFSCSFTL